MMGILFGLIGLILIGCSTGNLNSIRTEWTGGWVKASPADTTTPGKIEIGMGYGSLTIVPMARGQGAKFTAITYELISGHPLFAEEIIVYPMGQDAILRLEKSPQSILKIPYLIDIKEESTPLTPTTIEIVPVK